MISPLVASAVDIAAGSVSPARYRPGTGTPLAPITWVFWLTANPPKNAIMGQVIMNGIEGAGLNGDHVGGRFQEIVVMPLGTQLVVAGYRFQRRPSGDIHLVRQLLQRIGPNHMLATLQRGKNAASGRSFSHCCAGLFRQIGGRRSQTDGARIGIKGVPSFRLMAKNILRP